MLTRALIVVLVLLNLSVALWWMLRSDPLPQDVKPPSGVASLQLLAPDDSLPATDAAKGTAPLEDAANEASTPPVATVVPSEPAPTPLPATNTESAADKAVQAPSQVAAVEPSPVRRCVALGPFPDQATAQAAQARLGNALGTARLQEQSSPSTTTRYRVMLPPAASREDAQATVQRIVAAGLGDYYIIAQGPEANAIALGQYRNREGAERRLETLRAAGFQARLQGGDAAATWWLQGTLGAGQTADGVRRRSGAAQQRSLDCTRLR